MSVYDIENDIIHHIEIKTVRHDCAHMPVDEHYSIVGEVGEKSPKLPPEKRKLIWGSIPRGNITGGLLYCPWCCDELPQKIDLERTFKRNVFAK